MNGKVLARDALGLNIVKTRRRLLMFGPVLRWKVLSRKSAGGKLPEAFVMPVFLYGWSTTVYRKMDDNKLRNVENTARQMTLSLHSERQMSVQVLAEKFPEKCRFDHWTSLHISGDKVAKLSFNSHRLCFYAF
ncbi:unnamed protein product [Hymenolepis diminuta]|uniref:Uncharacterized protein n=1 Tax=Hymenolepis diminuta TaxID=6216 RepID=A0A564Y4C8_HYMDI|nr:unnamed protein product [Hymenolepis diminuta]